MTTSSVPSLVLVRSVMEMSVFLWAASGSYLSSPLAPWLIWGRPGSSPQLPFPARPALARPWQTGCRTTQQRISAFHSSLAQTQGSLTCCWLLGSVSQQSGGLKNRAEFQFSMLMSNVELTWSDSSLCLGYCFFTEHAIINVCCRAVYLDKCCADDIIVE